MKKYILSLFAILVVAMITTAARADELASFTVCTSYGTNVTEEQDASHLVNGVTTDKWYVNDVIPWYSIYPWVLLKAADDYVYKPTKYWFYTGNDINNEGEGYRNPTAWTLIASTDGITWVTLDTQKDQTLPTSCSTKTDEYAISTSEYYRYFRLKIDGVVEPKLMEIGEFQMSVEKKASPIVEDSHFPLCVYKTSPSSSYWCDVYHLVDDDPTTKWQVKVTDALGYSKEEPYVILSTGDGRYYKPKKYWFYTGNDIYYLGHTSQIPEAWTVDGSNDRTTWDRLDIKSSQKLTEIPSTKTADYPITTDKYYKYFRLTIEGVINDGLVTDLGEFRMSGDKIATGVKYIDADGVEQTCPEATVLESYTGTKSLAAGWYVVEDDDVKITDGITCTGDVHIILTDGAKLTVKAQSTQTVWNEAIKVGSGNTLQIYGQTNGTGQLIAHGGGYAAGIGGEGKAVVINGGTITATGGSQAAGIGSTYTKTLGSVTINGGTITANCELCNGAGIGTGYGGTVNAITINGGTLTATGGENAAGIGCGSNGLVGTIAINGGIIKATGGKGGTHYTCAGIGRGYCALSGGLTSIVINKDIAVYSGSSESDATFFSNDGSNLKESLTKQYVYITEAQTTNVKYIDAEGVEQTCAVATIIESYTGNLNLAAGWYVVEDGDVNVTNGITCTGDVNLILADNAKLTITSQSGITGIYAGNGNTLQIFGQADNTGLLIANGASNRAGIGGAAKAVIINGGQIYAYGGVCGIGPNNSSTCESVTINKNLYTYNSAYSTFYDVTGPVDNDGSNLVSTLTQKYAVVRNTTVPVNYLRFVGQASGTIAFTKTEQTEGTITAVLQYNSNPYSPAAEWTDYTYGTQMTLGKNEALYFRAKEQSGVTPTFSVDGSNNIRFSATNKVAAGGNIMSLLNFGSMTSRAFAYLFQNCTTLTEAPELPATTLADGCYTGMFHSCSGLTKAPELPATTLVEACYAYMFAGCTGLTETPDIKATTLAKYSIQGMFGNCSSLSKATVHFTDWQNDVSATSIWMMGVASTGTFNYGPGLDVLTVKRGVDYIPEGWTATGIDHITTLSNGWVSYGNFGFDQNVKIAASTTEGVTAAQAYICSDVTSTEAQMQPVDIISQYDGVFIKGNPNTTYTLQTTEDNGSGYERNYIIGCPKDTEVSKNAYVLASYQKDGATVSGLYYVNTTVTVPAGKAYIDIPTTISSPAKQLTMTINDGNTTDVSEVSDAKNGSNGKFIKNGQLVILKNGNTYNAAGQKLH